jgi:hypothetical protein
MVDEKPDGAEGPVERPVRKILAQIGALNERLRGREQDEQGGSEDPVEVEREDDGSSRIDGAYLPA